MVNQWMGSNEEATLGSNCFWRVKEVWPNLYRPNKRSLIVHVLESDSRIWPLPCHGCGETGKLKEMECFEKVWPFILSTFKIGDPLSTKISTVR